MSGKHRAFPARRKLTGSGDTMNAFTAHDLEADAFAQVGVDPLDMQRVDREPALVLLPRPRHDSEAELMHARSVARNLV